MCDPGFIYISDFIPDKCVVDVDEATEALLGDIHPRLDVNDL